MDDPIEEAKACADMARVLDPNSGLIDFFWELHDAALACIPGPLADV